VLARIDRAELALKQLGYRILRVRHFGELGRVELGGEELRRALTPAGRDEVTAAVAAAGYSAVEISEEPFRSGSLNGPSFTRLLAVTPG
jgi:pyridinium-3,5-biscarboxylic acid mononucleotide sulfurtransferase